MTARHQQIVRFIESYWHENWMSPTVREIAEACGMSSSSSAHYRLEQMTRLGILERRRVGARVVYRVIQEENQLCR